MSHFAEDLLARFRWIEGHADVLGLFADGVFLRRAIDALAGPFRDAGVTQVAGVEARGFILGGAVATHMGAGFLPVRKPGAIHPGPKAVQQTVPDWRGRQVALAIQREALRAGDRVLLVDDWAETGSQALAARALVEECGGTWIGVSLLVDQLRDDVRARLAPVAAVVLADQLPPSAAPDDTLAAKPARE
ncbi:MAG: phosphoribosyltransferase [Actinobacteria bacterium]|nr:phosphoribosyltransferase [Actinomycetota bacterium]